MLQMFTRCLPSVPLPLKCRLYEIIPPPELELLMEDLETSAMPTAGYPLSELELLMENLETLAMTTSA